MTIGRCEELDEQQARKRAKDALAKVTLGQDPQVQKVEARARAAVTLGRVAEQYLARARAHLKPGSYVEVERHIARHWAPLAGLPLDKISRPQVAARLLELTTAYGPVAANRAHSALTGLFNWAIRQGLTLQNPASGLDRNKETPRERVLSADDLRVIWAQLHDDEFSRIIKLLLLTGQRRTEVAGLRWSELDLDRSVWKLPASRTKNGREHLVPLSDLALEIIEQVQRRDGRDLLFGRDDGPYCGWSVAKARIDARINKALQDAGGPGLAPWTLHDVRRSVATHLAEDLQVQPHIIETLLNHQIGSRVAKTYNRAIYLNEKRQALQGWTEQIKSIVGLGSNVVALEPRRTAGGPA
jgi:integrase